MNVISYDIVYTCSAGWEWIALQHDRSDTPEISVILGLENFNWKLVTK